MLFGHKYIYKFRKVINKNIRFTSFDTGSGGNKM